jgi:HTH-type transcriptional regulator/antitoxin HigA
MAAKATYRLTHKNRDSYLELIQDFPLASIRSEAHLVDAQEVIDRLLAQVRLDEGEELYLDALSDLVGAYEDDHHAIGPATDADMLRHFMEAKGVTQATLSRELAMPKSTISEVLAGKKPFSRLMMRQFADYFNVDIGILAANI